MPEPPQGQAEPVRGYDPGVSGLANSGDFVVHSDNSPQYMSTP